MSSADERVNIYDEKGNFLQVMNRLQAEAENLRTENVVIALFTPDGKLWLQQRALYKTYHPGLWDISACGGVESHEHRDQAAIRETLEETGLSPKLTRITSIPREVPFNGAQLHRYSHIYTGVTADQPVPNKEVIGFKAWDLEELYKHMADHPEQYIDELAKFIRSMDTKNPSS